MSAIPSAPALAFGPSWLAPPSALQTFRPSSTPAWGDGDAFSPTRDDGWPDFCAGCVRDVDPGAPSLHGNSFVGWLEDWGLAEINHKPYDMVTGTRPENLSVLGGLVDLGSPGEPGAGTAETWWLPDRLLGVWDMSDFYLAHDQLFDRNRTLADLPSILGAEARSFAAGMSKPSHYLDPARWIIQGAFSAATTTAALGFATYNTVSDFLGSLFG